MKHVSSDFNTSAGSQNGCPRTKDVVPSFEISMTRSAKKALQTFIHAVARERRRLRGIDAPGRKRLMLKLFDCTVCVVSAFRFSL